MEKIEISVSGVKKDDVVVVIGDKKYSLTEIVEKPTPKPEVKEEPKPAVKADETLSKAKRKQTIKKVAELIQKEGTNNDEIKRVLVSKLGKKIADEIYQAAQAEIVLSDFDL